MSVQRYAIVILGVLLQQQQQGVPFVYGMVPSLVVDRPESLTDLDIDVQLLQYDSSESTCSGDPTQKTNITSFTISDTSNVRTVSAATVRDGVHQQMKFEVVCPRDNTTNGSVVMQVFTCDDQSGEHCQYSHEMHLTNTVEFSQRTCERFTSDSNNTNSVGYLYVSGGLFNVSEFIFGCPDLDPHQSSTRQRLTTEPTTTMNNGFLQSSFEVVEGGEYCKVALKYGDCVQDYAQYHNRESCIIVMKKSGYICSGVFKTEPGYDFVTISGVGYSGTDGPDNVFVSTGEQILWESDNTTTDLGWRLCFSTTTHKPATTATDMTRTWMIVIGVVFAVVLVVMVLVLRSRLSATKKLEDYTELENWQAVHDVDNHYNDPDSPQPYEKLNHRPSQSSSSGAVLHTLIEEYEPTELHHQMLKPADMLATTTTLSNFCTMCGLAMISDQPCHGCRRRTCSVGSQIENEFVENLPRRNSLYE